MLPENDAVYWKLKFVEVKCLSRRAICPNRRVDFIVVLLEYCNINIQKTKLLAIYRKVCLWKDNTGKYSTRIGRPYRMLSSGRSRAIATGRFEQKFIGQTQWWMMRQWRLFVKCVMHAKMQDVDEWKRITEDSGYWNISRARRVQSMTKRSLAQTQLHQITPKVHSFTV